MTCWEVRNLAALHLSGEMNREQSQAFRAHLTLCPDCERDMEQLAFQDQWIARLLKEESVDSSPVEQRFRAIVSAERSGRRSRWAAMAAAVVVAASIGGYYASRFHPVPRFYADAARDHRVEVIEHKPRRWRSGSSEVEPITAPIGLSFSQVEALASDGYSLEHAKLCGLEGQRVLHMVFSNGVRQYSIYLRPHPSGKQALKTTVVDSEHVAGVETGRFEALLVTAGSAQECDQLARSLIAKL